ncbi:MAG: TonB-dependent siderophore receptor [SAR86 cluster bacterium]|uniref:TonB-dependent siderophore receptor n=1 Tax=SAR86 cluster bacterium TaxID=2030880 RepID=A0A2A5ATV1_9GAMM|nr:MAG: TonB-dependent siderophore receptor [SAR86 cluster bacterium]
MTTTQIRQLPDRRKSLVAAIALVVMGMATSALAVAVESTIEEIVVTGQGGVGSIRLGVSNSAGSRLGLSGLSTPASVDIISRDEIATKGDYSALDAVTRTTGISASANPGNGGTSISSRGFNGHGSTVYTYDGTRLYIVAGTVTFPADTWTLDRVEVLRGAGSVINGVGALGTTINYVPKSPVFGDSNFEAVVAAGSFEMKRLAVGGGAQISDEWAFRLDASHQEEDGYVDRADKERDVFAGSLLYQPNADLSVRFSVDYADVDTAPFWGTPLINGKASSSHRQNNYNFADGKVQYEDTWSRIHVEWNVADNITFRSDTYLLDATREWQNLEEYAYNSTTDLIDRAYYLGIIHEEEQVGSRFDFLVESDLGGMENRLSLGAEVNDIDLNYLNNFSTGGFGVGDSVPVFGFNPGATPEATIPTILDYQTDTRQYAIFIDDVLQINDQLSLVLGGRFDDIDYDRFDLAIGGNPASRFSAGFSEFTWRAGLVYQPTEQLSFYAQTSTAADPVTSPVSISSGNKDFDLATGRQYEVGLKQQFMQGRGEYTLAYFDIEKQDILTRRPASAITEQIGQQSSDGFEFSLRVNPIESLSIDFNAAFIDVEFDEFYSGGVSLAGNTPRSVPEQTVNLWLNWSPINNVQVGGGFRYVDSRYADNENNEKMPEYTVFDASINWMVSDELTITARAKNLTDEEDYVLSPYVSNQWIFGDPRSYELSLRYSF